jgi:carboxyl-terminal processing protease
MSAYAGQRMLAGAPGSRTTLLMLRANAVEPRPIDLIRETPGQTRATARRLPGGQAYVRVASFGPGVVNQIQTSVASLGAAATRGLILDVRDTADGAPQDGAAAARLFVKNGTLSTLQARAGVPTVTSAGAADGALAMPLVVIVSGGTAHAAEVFAAALADNKRATLVGTPTAGLAGSQTLVKLEDPAGDHGLLLTTARYMRADGTAIHGRGLRPLALVEVPLVGFDDPAPQTDVALERALVVLENPSAAAAPAAPQGASTATPPNPHAE